MYVIITNLLINASSGYYGYCTDICIVFLVATEWTYVLSVCTVWSYVCSVCTELTVLLVPLILLGKVNVIVDISSQNEVPKARERPDWTQQAVVTAFLLQQQLYVYGWPGCVYGRPVRGPF